MNSTNSVGLICLLLAILLIAIALSGWLKRHWLLSLAASFVLVEFVTINGFVLVRPLPSLPASQLQLLSTYVLLPIILADAAYRFRIHDLRYQRLQPMLLLAPVFFISLLFAFLFFLWVFSGQPELDLLIILAASLLIFMADMFPSHKTLSALNSLDKVSSTKTRYTTLIQVESLLIGALTLMLFLAIGQLTDIDSYTKFKHSSVTWYWLYWLWAFFGGVVFGFIWGVIGGLIATNIQNYRINLILLSTIIWLSYLSSLYFFDVSGIMALLTTTLIMSKAHTQFLTPREIKYMRALFRNLRFLVGIVIYSLLIYKLQINVFISHWFTMIMTVLVFIMARAISLYGFLPLILQLKHHQINANRQHTLFISTTHSSLILLAVWMLPESTPFRDSYEAMAMALVLMNLFVQQPNLSRLFQNLLPRKTIRGINLIKNR